MALNFKDLRVLSLSDGQTHDTLAAVTLYLRQRTSNGAMARPIFSLLGKDATAAFAETMARTSVDSKTIQERWSTEQEHAQQRVNEHWKAVQMKQKEVERLRLRLSVEKLDLHRAEIARSSVPTKYEQRITGYSKRGNAKYDQVATSEYEAANRNVARCESAVKATESSIKSELQAPSPVIQPLPPSDSEALSMLFLMYMPKSLSALANLSFAAQEALLPPAGWSSLSDKEKLATQTKSCDFDWIDHHTNHQEGPYVTVSLYVNRHPLRLLANRACSDREPCFFLPTPCCASNTCSQQNRRV